jgi:hypothetical protein
VKKGGGVETGAGWIGLFLAHDADDWDQRHMEEAPGGGGWEVNRKGAHSHHAYGRETDELIREGGSRASQPFFPTGMH